MTNSVIKQNNIYFYVKDGSSPKHCKIFLAKYITMYVLYVTNYKTIITSKILASLIASTTYKKH